ASAATLPDPPAAADDALMAKMLDPQTLSALEQLAAALHQYVAARQAAAAAFPDDTTLDAAAPGEVKTLADAAAQAALGEMPASQAMALAEKRRQQGAAWAAVAALLAQIAQHAAIEGPFTPETE